MPYDIYVFSLSTITSSLIDNLLQNKQISIVRACAISLGEKQEDGYTGHGLVHDEQKIGAVDVNMATWYMCLFFPRPLFSSSPPSSNLHFNK